ncbi:hypothetical protein DPMN_017765, partial [Dreissena polymorpha]
MQNFAPTVEQSLQTSLGRWKRLISVESRLILKSATVNKYPLYYHKLMTPIDFEATRYIDHDSQMTPIDFEVT